MKYQFLQSYPFPIPLYYHLFILENFKKNSELLVLLLLLPYFKIFSKMSPPCYYTPYIKVQESNDGSIVYRCSWK